GRSPTESGGGRGRSPPSPPPGRPTGPARRGRPARRAGPEGGGRRGRGRARRRRSRGRCAVSRGRRYNPQMAVAREDIVELLAGVPAFETLGPEDLRHVADVAVPRRCAAGEVIFREGDEGDTCYIVR